jgi:hypothetical protein
MGQIEHWIAMARGTPKANGSKRPVTLELGEFTLAGMEDLGRRREMSLDTIITRATRHYLENRGAGPGWRYPQFAREAEGRLPQKRKELTVKLTSDLVRAAGREAQRQQVSLERLLEHAALYYLADAARGGGGQADPGRL